MLNQKKKLINGVTYAVTQMDGFRALKTQTKLIKILGPAVASVLTGGDLDSNTIYKTLLAELPNILSRFDDNIVNEFIASLFEHNVFKLDSLGNPDKIDFGIEFGGRINDMWKVALFILEVNFFAGKSIMSSLPTTEQNK